MDRDFYKTLGVARDSSQDEVRKAYRKLAHRYHPDKTGGDKPAEDKLKEINEAYDVLKNKEKRAKYDRYGEAGAQMGQGGGGGGASPFDDIFDAFFSGGGGGRGGRSRAQAATVGNDLEYRVTLSLKAAAAGTKKSVHFARKENCGDCSGSGAAKGSSAETCRQCEGQGQVRMAQGFFSISRTCPVCHGVGQMIKDPCRRCRGEGQVEMDRELSVDLPAGVDTGSRLCLRGEGEPGRNGGPRGDLYIFVEVKPDDLFEREGNDILCQIPVSFPQVILGSTIRVPTLNGEAELKIPAGTQSGTLFKLRGMGIPDIRGYQQGDQIVEIQVETPTKLSREQKEMIKRFEELSDTKTYPLHLRFMKKIRKSFGG
jgi:molecular chaperone DnaJ